MNIEPISRSCITYSTVISLDCARNNIALNYDLTHAPESCFLCENLLQQLHFSVFYSVNTQIILYNLPHIC